MTSTDVPRISRRLPPLPGLLDDTLDQAIRARQRRIFIADNPNLSLGAMRVSDKSIDQAIVSASLYGQDAARQLDARIAASTGAAQEAAVFLRLALATHAHDPAMTQLAAEYAAQHPRAVRDALWFYPVPSGPFTDSADHVVALFDASADSPSLRQLALELAGRRDVKALRDQIAPLLDDPQQGAMAHLTLSCMGYANDATRRFVNVSLASGNQALRDAALAIAAVDPRLAEDAALKQVIQVDPEADAAWAILACRHPHRAHEHARQRDDLPESRRMRIAALTGHLDGIIRVCAEVTDKDGPVSPAQADVLQLALGDVPMEARCEPSDREQKSAALRALLLRVCRHSHIPLQNDADRCPWSAEAILAKPEQASSIRLRGGEPWRSGVPAFGQAVIEVTHGMRQWLYIERAVLGQHALPLSALDVARRQELALMVAELADELRPD